MRSHWNPEIAARKQKNREIFMETLSLCRAGVYRTPSGREVALPDPAEVRARSAFYVNPPDATAAPTCGETVIDVVNGDCMDVTRDLVKAGYNPVMLNMANRHTPGGGVLDGSRAQEESLFRCSNLAVSLYQYDDGLERVLDIPGLARGEGRYPMDRDTGGVYSGLVRFFRAGVQGGDALLDEPFDCAVVSVAAINRPDLTPEGRLVDWAVRATESKIRTMLRIGLHHGHDAIVLGAWGCGAFHNPPAHMAEIFHRVLLEPEFANKFRLVRFAVIEDHNSRHANYAPFAAEFAPAPAPSASGAAQAAPEGLKGVDRNRLKGMLWGLVVGDCFGSPIQFSRKDAHPWITEMVACPVFHLPAGYWTDDSSMAFCVMDSFVRQGGYDLADIGTTFCQWLYRGYRSSVDGKSFDVGNATYSSCDAIRHRGSLVNGTEESQGNGSIMRFAPSYLVARTLARPAIVHEVSDLTHASSAVRAVCDRFASVLDGHLAGVRTTQGPGRELARKDVPNSGWSVATLQAALWAFNTTDSFEDGLVAAVNLGGDSDSIGAVFGQIAGAYYGFDAIPRRWVEAVKTWQVVDGWIEEFLDALAHA